MKTISRVFLFMLLLLVVPVALQQAKWSFMVD